MARPTTPSRQRSSKPTTSRPKADGHAPLISPDADAILSRIVSRYFVFFIVLLILLTFVMPVLNVLPAFHLYRARLFLDSLSALILLLPLFIGTSHFFAVRLRFGREYVEKKQWKEAVAALEAFNHFGQRFLDRSGEAHYLLSVALGHMGRIDDSRKARDFVTHARRGTEWARKAKEDEESKAAIAKSRTKRPETPSARPQEIRPRPTKDKRRRL